MEHLIGYIIIGLSVVLTGIMVFVRWRQWKTRWLDAWEERGVRVRFAYGAERTPEIQAQVVSAIAALRQQAQADRWLLDQLPPSKLMNFWVEIVPPGKVSTPTVPSGKLPDGSLVGGSIKSVRFLPVTRLYRVAVVVNDRTDGFIIHEVTRHIWGIMLGIGVDASHSHKKLEAIERAVKFKAARIDGRGE